MKWKCKLYESVYVCVCSKTTECQCENFETKFTALKKKKRAQAGKRTNKTPKVKCAI